VIGAAGLLREGGDVALDGRVEVEAPGLVQLEQRDAGERLGDARDAEARRTRDRDAVLRSA
jgi:hypothetical protein